MHFQERVKKKNALGPLSIVLPLYERGLEATPHEPLPWSHFYTEAPRYSDCHAETKKGTVIPSLSLL
jgi:hypothetical protein